MMLVTRKRNNSLFVFLIFIGLAVRVILSYTFAGHPVDINCFKSWSLIAANDLSGFYTSGQFSDYPPLYIYVLFIIGKIAGALSLPYDSAAFNALVKMPSIAADILIPILILKMFDYNFQRNSGGKYGSNTVVNSGSGQLWNYSDYSIYTLTVAMYLFNPVSILNSSVWGQIDAVFTLFILLMLFYINTKLEVSIVFITLAVLLKPQGLIFIPIVLLELLKRKDVQVFLKSAAYSILTAFIVVLPFSFKQGPLWLVNLYLNTASEYKYATLNAFNLFMLFGANWKNDSEPFLLFSYSTWGIIFIVGLVVLVSYFYWKSRNKDLTAIFCGILLISGTFLLSSRMHERYMFPVLALLPAAFGLVRDRRLLVLIAGFTCTNFYNTWVVLIYAQQNYFIPADDFYGRLVSLMNLLLFAYMIKLTFDILLKQPSLKQTSLQQTKAKTPSKITSVEITASIYKPVKLDKSDLLIVSVITLVYLGISIFSIGGTNIPSTSWRPSSAGENFIVEFDREYDLSRVYYYNGYGDAKFQLEYGTPDGHFLPLGSIDKTYLDFYAWRFAKVQAKTSRVRVTVESYVMLNSSGGQQDLTKTRQYTEGPLLEMAFVEEGSTKPIEGISIISLNDGSTDERNAGNLFDEQYKMEYAPSNKTGTIFDEIYHVRTAYEFLNSLTPFENTHPPLGKAIISLGIIIFGMNPFGWRIMGVLFGAVIIPMMYVFGRKLFGNRLYGFFAAFLMMFDFMNLVQARIGTVDVFVVLFILIMYYFMYDSFSEKSYQVPLRRALLPLFLSGLFFGIGASAKWISIYAGAGLALLYFGARWCEFKEAENVSEEDMKKVFRRITSLSVWCVLFFVIIPAAIYYLSYIPFFGGKGFTFKDVWANQVGMFSYHSGLKATHSFASDPWSWPLIAKPVWFYTNAENAFNVSTVSTIVTMGNPAIWWISLVCVPAAGIIAWKKRDRNILPVFVGLAFQYIPWFFVTRLMFIYHFYSSVPFIIFCIVYVMKYIIENYPQNKKWVYGYLSAVLILFIMFYPVLTGLEVSRNYIENYLRWFKNTWYF